MPRQRKIIPIADVMAVKDGTVSHSVVTTDATTQPDATSSSLRRAVSYVRVSTLSQVETDFSSDGLSIPAQLDFCREKAEALGAIIVDEYVDRGESARFADRPALQELLNRLRTMHDIDYVIVHKLDRLARSTSDDVAIATQIRSAGAQLVSITENIDETPTGRLVHAIMAGVAEFYSGNLAMEAKKGMTQKAKLGGTPNRAPIGYLNVRERFDGKEVRSIAIDPERADLVRWAFQTFASGDWTIRRLHAELENRGLKTRGDRRGPAKPLSKSKVHELLRNPYYVGIVVFDGVMYQGRHEPLVDLGTFQRVQELLTSHRISGEKPKKINHYLKGTVFCGRCGSRLGLTHSKGRGGVFEYFYCLGRQRRNGCMQPFVRVEEIEDLMESFWGNVELASERIAEIKHGIATHIETARSLTTKEVERQQERLRKLKGEQRKLVQAHYAEAITIELLREETNRIKREEAQALSILQGCTMKFDDIGTTLDNALRLLANCQALYRSAKSSTKRLFNQAVFERIWIIDNRIVGADLTGPFGVLLHDQLPARLTVERDALAQGRLDGLMRATEENYGSPSPGQQYERSSGRGGDRQRQRLTRLVAEQSAAAEADWSSWAWSQLERPTGLLPWETRNPDNDCSRGVNVLVLVGAEGLEPTTPSL